MRKRQGFVALTLGDVRNTDSDQPPFPGRQPAEADLAGNLPALRILVHPLEGRMAAVQRLVDVAAAHAERRRSVRLLLRADFLGTDGQEAGA